MSSGGNLALGLMSGTSADGVSAALGQFQDHKFKLIGHLNHHYPSSLIEAIRKGGALSAKELSLLNVEIGRQFAQSAQQLLRKTNTKPSAVTCIGSHGQTIYHGPDDSHANTLQIGDPAVIAQKTNIPVVSHFRQGDIAAGGEGAPLIPFFDHYFFGQGRVQAQLNVGGIANVTLVGKNSSPLAFDTGPGNALMDRAMKIITRGKENHDHFGQRAKSGAIKMDRVQKMMEHPYFKKAPPKSTGPEVFGDAFLKTHFNDLLKKSPNDVLATLNYFTCLTVQESFRNFIFRKFNVEEIVVSGGGVLNKTLLKKLECLFAPIPVVSIEKKGIPAQAKEPLAFAFFGLRRMQKKTNHLPSCTRAKKTVLLGSVTKP